MIQKLSGIFRPSSAAVQSAKLLSLTGAARTASSKPALLSQACQQGIQHSTSSSEAASDCLAGSKAFHACYLSASCMPDTSSMSLQHYATAASVDSTAVPAALSSKHCLSDTAAKHDCKAVDSRRTLYQQVSSNAKSGIVRKRAPSADRPDHTSKPARIMGSSKGKQAQLSRKGLTDLGQGAQVLYYPRMFNRAEAAEMLTSLQTEVAWQQKEVTVHGKRVMQPRMVAYMADEPSLAYTYSRQTMIPDSWTPAVRLIKARLEQETGAVFNSCLLNLYRNGRDHMSYHSDNEALYGPQPVIGSVSFGEARAFILRQNSNHACKLNFALGNGDMLTMQGTTQDHWMHAVPRRLQCSGSRISLTFRKIVCPEDLQS
ncbi:hypothetical protein CVIRNUC_002861 [Coccomyxa viridis]|uniref:Fe2OG dioxygenase domain-containing protein n=1 Tax=Coccomyxa viridis TaxID=1274662 RepID=A0AAV1HY26_9CHLO|nr:hypothetical protein CVIRNUC_002861 [Coccomyxa viridis]